jgi:CDP-glucose 4,6-dehydratase
VAEQQSTLENLVMKANFWNQKTVLITGHTGFKGSWLSLWLQKKGANIIGYSLPPPTEPSLFEIAQVAQNMNSIEGDIRDLDHLCSIIAKFEPEIIIHMAAQPIVRLSYINPIETYSTNVMGTAHVLEAVRVNNCVKVLIVITSDKCYENKEWLWGYREKDALGGRDPYSSSKGCAELITSAYRESFFSGAQNQGRDIFVASTRAGNVIGGGDWAQDRLVPDIMRGLIERRAITIRYPNAIRPWQHVLVPLSGYLSLSEHLWDQGKKFEGAWNFGPREEDTKRVWWLADYLIHKWGQGARWINDQNQIVHEDTLLKLDCSKARTLLKWEAKLELETTLDWIVSWYKAYVEGKDMREETLGQIARYEKLSENQI